MEHYPSDSAHERGACGPDLGHEQRQRQRFERPCQDSAPRDRLTAGSCCKDILCHVVSLLLSIQGLPTNGV